MARMNDPGAHLAEELTELNMSAAALARKLNVPTNRITAILGRRVSTTLRHSDMEFSEYRRLSVSVC